jgi:Antitoxin VbhA
MLYNQSRSDRMTKATRPGPPLCPDERTRRKKAIDYARGSVRLEGFILDDRAEALFARYVNSEIDRHGLDAAVADLAVAYG